MPPAPEQVRAAKQTTLQRTITTALNELGAEAALVGIFERADGPLTLQGMRGFTSREAQAILRALSMQEAAALTDSRRSEEGEPRQGLRLRLITPAARSFLAIPLRHKQRAYGVLVVGRKEGGSYSKKEKGLLESAGDEMTTALDRAALFDGTVLLQRPYVTQEPLPASEPQGMETQSVTASYATPAMQEQVAALLDEAQSTLSFDRAWVCAYDPVAGAVEVVGSTGEGKTEQKADLKREMKAVQRLPLDSSASGWAVRHRKPRVDQDLASTQGRFLDHKQLYKERYLCALVVPFFIRGQVGGTITLASKTPMRYSLTDARTLEPIVLKLVELWHPPTPSPQAQADSGVPGDGPPVATPPTQTLEPLIRKQERHAAIGEFSSWLAAEVREPLGAVRAQLGEVTSERALDFDTQTRIESATRDVIRVETILNEILDFAKPLELNRRLCRIPEVIENALSLVTTDLDVNRIQVTKDYGAHLLPVRCDDAKMVQVFLSIFKNAVEAMTPGGHLHVEVALVRSGRPQLQMTIKNDGAPIPTEHASKVFEPFFSTKRAGSGLGLATVKKIVEEHQGQISIASGPGQGTAVIILIPAILPRRGPFRGRGRGRRSPRGR
jgi:signal transduction histidine kinase